MSMGICEEQEFPISKFNSMLHANQENEFDMSLIANTVFNPDDTFL